MPSVGRLPVAVPVVVCLLGLLPAAAYGHGYLPPFDEDAIKGHRATVDGIEPGLAGVTIRVLGGEHQLELENRSGQTIVVLGYEEEPYLRIEPDAVFLNARSRATYLNRGRFGRGRVPSTVDPNAKPLWRRVSGEPVYAWHDHRIHWMQGTPPAAVSEEPRRRQRIRDWKVPLVVDGRRVTVQGHLDYVPPGRLSGSLLAVGITIGGLGVAAVLLLLGRRTARTRPTPGVGPA
jgi:hypothetical protein